MAKFLPITAYASIIKGMLTAINRIYNGTPVMLERRREMPVAPPSIK
jgi:hypothetical protein